MTETNGVSRLSAVVTAIGVTIIGAILTISGSCILDQVKTLRGEVKAGEETLTDMHAKAIETLKEQIEVTAKKSDDRGTQQASQQIELARITDRLESQNRTLEKIVVAQEATTNAVIRLTTIAEERERSNQTNKEKP